jgi:hypothetical protein
MLSSLSAIKHLRDLESLKGKLLLQAHVYKLSIWAHIDEVPRQLLESELWIPLLASHLESEKCSMSVAEVRNKLRKPHLCNRDLSSSLILDCSPGVSELYEIIPTMYYEEQTCRQISTAQYQISSWDFRAQGRQEKEEMLLSILGDSSPHASLVLISNVLPWQFACLLFG